MRATERKKIIIVFESYHHLNTEKIALLFAQVLQAELYKPEQINLARLSEADMIGIGSGIYFGKLHENIRAFLEELPFQYDKKSFFFVTSGVQRQKYIQHFGDKMKVKGMKLVDYFSCKGFDTRGPLKLIGGISRGHPDLTDLYNAEIFANKLLNEL